MIPRPVKLCAALAALTLAPEAFAQTANPFRLSVERAFGVGYSSFTASSTTMAGGTTVTRETTVTGIGVSLFGQGYSAITPAATLGALVPTQQLPRLALDYELGSHLTLGASAFVSYGSYTGADGDGAAASGFGLAPRVGYSLSLGDRLAFWPRVGVTFAYSTSSPIRASSGSVASSATSSYTTLALNLEPTLVYQLATHFGLTAGVVVDVPFVGTLTTRTTLTSGGRTVESTTDSTLTQLYFGLQLGVMGRF